MMDTMTKDLWLTARQDLTQSGCQIEPFFVSTPEKPFDVTKFYSVRHVVHTPLSLDQR